METQRIQFFGGPMDGMKLRIDPAPNGSLPDRWNTIEDSPRRYDLQGGTTPTRTRHEYWLDRDRTGQPRYVHRREEEWNPGE